MSATTDTGHPPDAGRGRGAQVVGTLVAVALASQVVQNLLAPAGDVSPWWNVPVAALLVAAVVLLWRADPPWRLVFAMLLCASLLCAFATFGHDGFAVTLAWVAATMLGLYFAVVHVAVPVIFWRQGRWPADGPLPLQPLDGDLANVPDFFAERVRALAALGFAPRATLAQGDRSGQLDIVFFAHERDGLLALASRMAILARRVDTTQFTVLPAPGSLHRVSVIDEPVPDPFPPMPDAPTYLFPGESPDALLAILRQLNPEVPPIGAFAAPGALFELLARLPDLRLAWLIERGYLHPQPVDGAHRYTAKGALVAAWRSLWPGSALVRANRRRIARAALRAATAAR